MKSSIKYFLIIFFIITTFNSCYLAPETSENGNISLAIPLNDILNKSVPYGTAGFEVIIVGGTIADPENISEDDELVFYYKEFLLTNDAFEEYTPGEYIISLDNVPEGENLNMVIIYKDSDLQYDSFYDMEYGTIGYFVTSEPFTVESNKTTYIELEAYVYYYDPRPA